MREILFRGKRTDNGEWVHGAYSAYDSRLTYYNGQVECEVAFIPSIIAYDDECFWYHVDPATVGQYTGLTDKHGKRIFEGDILKAIAGNPVGEPIVANVVPNLNDYELMWDIEHSYELEIIGNIHDNPELLKGGATDG